MVITGSGSIILLLKGFVQSVIEEGYSVGFDLELSANKENLLSVTGAPHSQVPAESVPSDGLPLK